MSLTLEDGSRIFGLPNIKNEVVNHYCKLLGRDSSPYPSKARLEPLVGKRLRDHQKDELNQEVTHDEVESTLFSIHPNKSPGPNGFNADENMGVVPRDPLHVPIGPITRARVKRFKKALNGLIHDTWANSELLKSKISPHENQGLINIIKAIDWPD